MLLELKNIVKKFETPLSENYLTVLDNVSFSIDEGESVSIVGPSGSGKSTLLNIIGTLDQPTTGEVLLRGQDLNKNNSNRKAEIRSKEFGFIFQLHHLLPQCTVEENILLPTLTQNSKSTQLDHQRAIKLLERVGLQNRSDYFPGQLSGGELQRVAVVRALINSPRLILADEPTGSLDRKASLNLANLLKEIDEEVSLIIVTHSTEIASLMDRKYRLENGKLILED
ncbi:MAG: ABC transporter ATP-binding protein [Melioribacteraceae bacterium]|nr:ABC transporter ATP-binding protein [Melioribacteraceae bacterium]